MIPLRAAEAPAAVRDSPPSADTDHVVEFWRTEQGLPHNTVNAILQTRDGYLWVGTAGGLVRFDGLNFTPIGDEAAPGLKDARITALLQDQSGVLWIGTQGSGVFQIERGQATRFTAAEGLADNAVTSLAEGSSGTVWIGTQRGLNQWQNGKLATFASPVLRAGDGVVALHAGRSGVVWITTRAEVYRMKDGGVEPFRIQGVPQEANAELRGAYEDRAGNLWAFGATYLLNVSQGKRHNAFGSLDSASSRVWSLCEQDDGTFWIGTSGRGLVRFHEGRFDVVGSHEGLDQCDVRALFADHEGNLWIGTSGNGLARLRIRQWRMFSGSDGLASTKLTALAAAPSGELWVGTEDAGLMRFNGTRFESFAAGFPLNCAMHIQSLCVDRAGAVWVATWGQGLFRAAGGRQWHFGTGEGLSDDVVLAIAAERDADVVWAGTRAGGLHRISATNVMSFTAADGLTGQPIRCVLPVKEGLLVGSEGGGLVRWDGNQLAPVPSPTALTTQAVHCVVEDRAGRLWAGTAGGGVFCRSGATWLNLTSADGLASDVIEQIVLDEMGNLWLGSDKGIFQIRAAEVHSFLTGNARTVSPLQFARGMGQGDVKCATGWPGTLRTPQGELWFASGDGLLSIDPARTRAATALPVMIEQVSVDGQVVAGAESGGDKNPLQLGPGARSLDIAFTAVNFTTPEKTRFRHKLEGFDADWVESDVARRAHYGPLPPGRYQFLVIASSAGGRWSETGAALSLVVLPPLWRAWWFITACSGALVALIWMVVRYVVLRRLRAALHNSEHRRAMERERARIAQDMHDEIGSKLTRISFLSEVVRQGGVDGTDSKAPVEAIASTSRELLKALDEIVWAVNPRNDNLENLVGYLEQYAREYFMMTPVECEISVPPLLPSVELSAELRHNVFLAFEEALGNALKHASPTKICVEMSVSGNEFEVEVKDDGRGFAANVADARPGRDGLINMAARLRAVGGRCEMTSEPGRGTRVRLSCPLPDVISQGARG